MPPRRFPEGFPKDTRKLPEAPQKVSRRHSEGAQIPGGVRPPGFPLFPGALAPQAAERRAHAFQRDIRFLRLRQAAVRCGRLSRLREATAGGRLQVVAGCDSKKVFLKPQKT